MNTKFHLIVIVLLLWSWQATQPLSGIAQTSPQQDSTINNLIHPPGYTSSKLGMLGSIKKIGTGKQTLILIPGLGFGAEVFDDFIKVHKQQYTMYAVTPAGFSGTSAPPMPDSSVKYADLPWTNGIVQGVLNLIEREKLRRPIIVSHFVTGTQVALQLALQHPDRIGKVIIIGGSPYRYFANQITRDSMDWEHEKILTPEQRSKVMEIFFAPKWFKTVTKRTWDNNMWTPDDYCKDSTKGASLFKASADVPLPVMVRYLIEWMAFDVSARYKDIRVPTLVLMPDFKSLLSPSDTTNLQSCKLPVNKIYLKYFHLDEAWRKAKDAANPLLTFQTIPQTRLFMWYDQPKAVYSAVQRFINQK